MPPSLIRGMHILREGNSFVLTIYPVEGERIEFELSANQILVAANSFVTAIWTHLEVSPRAP